MNDSKPRTAVFPWILFVIAIVICFILGFFLILSLLFNVFSFRGSSGYPSFGNLAVVEVSGVIEGSKDIVAALKKLSKDDSVKAVVLRVDSPGGAVAPSQEIYDSVKELAKKKTVVASMGSVAASGGYYISSPATKIVANPGTITGSIGVILQLVEVQDLLKKLYINWTVVKSGELKDIGSPLKKPTLKELKVLEDATLNIHEQFKRAVSESRKIPAKELDKIADGRFYTGEQALKLKLVDELGGLEKACQMAAKLGGIKGEPKIFYPETKKKKFWEYFAESMSNIAYQKIMNELYAVKPLFVGAR